MREPSIRLRACAKINWSLEVLGRRGDGYHEVRTVLQTIDLQDEVTLGPPDQSRDEGDWLRVEAPQGWDVPAGEDNLIAKAHTLLAALRPWWWRSRNVRVELQKHIPPAAGLGGGSSDAAAFLRGCAYLEPVAGVASLQPVAARLGSDVPFFLSGGTQLASGRGEQLEALPDVPRTWLVLVTPPLTLERKTARLYALLEAEHFSDGSRTEAVAQAVRVGQAPERNLLVNTFEAVADQAFTGLAGFRRALEEVCGFAMLCGAGPSLFSPVADHAEAQAAVRALRKRRMPAYAASTVRSANSTQYRLG